MAPANLEIVLPNGGETGNNSYAPPPFKQQQQQQQQHLNTVDILDDNGSEEGSESSDVMDLNMPRVVDGEDWNHISKPGAHDVLLGRGGGKQWDWWLVDRRDFSLSLFVIENQSKPTHSSVRSIHSMMHPLLALFIFSGTNNHMGNIKFRKLVNAHKMRYLAASKVDKPKVAREVVTLWRQMNPPGRFLARHDDTKRGPGSVKDSDNIWYEVGDKKAREKASQCLRERTPDVLPYIKHLREQQNAVTAQGVMNIQNMQQQQQQQQQQQHNNMQQRTSPSSHSPLPLATALSTPYGYPDGMAAAAAAYTNPPSSSSGMRRTSLPIQQGMPSPQGFSPGSRRSSLPNNMPNHSSMQQPYPAFSDTITNNYNNNNNNNNMMYNDNHHHNFLGGNHMDVSQMTDYEYQQYMMMMQQNLMQQHYQMQTLQQSRMQAQQQHQHRMVGGGGYNSHDPMMAGGGGGGGLSAHHSPPSQQPLNLHPDTMLSMPSSSSSDPPPRMPKRDRDGSANNSNGLHNNNNNNNNAATTATTSNNNDPQRAAPDRATSLMSLTPANPDDNELSLEKYREQLEAYLRNSKEIADEDELQDDWEKERDHTLLKQQQQQQQQQQKSQPSSQATSKERGVNRNMSGMSCLSMKSATMSLVSGFSGFTDMNTSNSRELKMAMSRSVCSNLSLMSDMTDLSQNIDNLSLYDDH
jgi:hypothetical protein